MSDGTMTGHKKKGEGKESFFLSLPLCPSLFICRDLVCLEEERKGEGVGGRKSIKICLPRSHAPTHVPYTGSPETHFGPKHVVVGSA